MLQLLERLQQLPRPRLLLLLVVQQQVQAGASRAAALVSLHSRADMHGSVCIWDCAESACEAVRQDD